MSGLTPGQVSPERRAAAQVRARIALAAGRAGRDPANVVLVAAAKDVAPERILASGVPDVGENRAQEMRAKQEALAAHPIRWHFIGALQRNKVRSVVGRVELIHSVDSAALGRAIASRSAAVRAGPQRVLIEVNLSGEASKRGVAPEELEAVVAGLRSEAGLDVRGLMTIPAPGEDPEESRPAFRMLRGLRDEVGLEHLSMGMSADFEVAVEEGATIVRVGTAIFGPRPG